MLYSDARFLQRMNQADEFTKLKDLVKEKPCTVVTNELHSLVPDFREIVKLINSTPDEEVDESRRLILRNMRPKLNRILQLQNLESSWLGSLSDILLGNFSAPGLPSFYEGCHIRFGSGSNMSLRENFPPDKLLVEGSNERKEPMILVMGSDIQVLPWESLPALERQEVYRMPSWLSISITLSCSAGCKIDPQNAYCLMPSKDHPTDLVQIMTRWLNNHYIKEFSAHIYHTPRCKCLGDQAQISPQNDHTMNSDNSNLLPLDRGLPGLIHQHQLHVSKENLKYLSAMPLTSTTVCGLLQKGMVDHNHGCTICCREKTLLIITEQRKAYLLPHISHQPCNNSPPIGNDGSNKVRVFWVFRYLHVNDMESHRCPYRSSTLMHYHLWRIHREDEEINSREKIYSTTNMIKMLYEKRCNDVTEKIESFRESKAINSSDL